MKKIFKKIIVLISITVLLIMPSATVFASSDSVPILTYYDSSTHLSYCTYTPDALDLANGQTAFLIDPVTKSNTWDTQAGKVFGFSVILPQGTFKVQVYRANCSNPGFVIDQSGCSNYFNASFVPINENCSYIVILTATSGNAKISSYVIQSNF